MDNNENNNVNMQPNLESQIMMDNSQQTMESTNTIFSNTPQEKPKKSRGPVIIIILLILIVLGLVGYIVYDKYFVKEETSKTTNKIKTKDELKEDKTIEYVSLDEKEYLKLNEDGTYEINVSTGVTGNALTKNGNYTKENDNIYSLDSGNKVEIKDGYIEITKMETEGFIFVNIVLFDKNKLNDIKAKIDNNVVTYVEGLGKNYPNVAEIEKTETKVNGSCFRYAMDENDSNQKYIKCSISYNIYLKNYNQSECKNEISNSGDSTNSKYIGYMIPAGECKDNYLLSGKLFNLNQDDAYKILNAFTGL